MSFLLVQIILLSDPCAYHAPCHLLLKSTHLTVQILVLLGYVLFFSSSCLYLNCSHTTMSIGLLSPSRNVSINLPSCAGLPQFSQYCIYYLFLFGGGSASASSFLAAGAGCIIICCGCGSGIFLLEPVYKPNHAAPAPTTILTRPLYSKFGASSAINQITTLYSSMI